MLARRVLAARRVAAETIGSDAVVGGGWMLRE